MVGGSADASILSGRPRAERVSVTLMEDDEGRQGRSTRRSSKALSRRAWKCAGAIAAAAGRLVLGTAPRRSYLDSRCGSAAHHRRHQRPRTGDDLLGNPDLDLRAGRASIEAAQRDREAPNRMSIPISGGEGDPISRLRGLEYKLSYFGTSGPSESTTTSGRECASASRPLAVPLESRRHVHPSDHQGQVTDPHRQPGSTPRLQAAQDICGGVGDH